MQIRLLGSVDVELNGSPVRLAGPEQRAVLAMLALNANEAVAVDRLVGGLWGEDPSASAPKIVQQYVSQLGRLLAGAGGPKGVEVRILSARFTPDGRVLATSSADGTVQLWDVTGRRAIGAPLMVEPEAYVAAAMSRDGRSVYALPTGRDGVRLAVSARDWKRQACAMAGREITRREWADALPGRDYRTVCGSRGP
jgi:hypothetical protein